MSTEQNQAPQVVAPEATPDAPTDAPPAEPTSPAGVKPAALPDCAAELKQRFPALFGGGPKPLKLRIQADIQERAPGVFSKQALSAFFRRYTGGTGYLIAMTKSPHRFDLDGNPAGEISEEHRQVASEELARRRELHQSKVDQAEEGRRNRAALLRDFETTTLTPANFCALKGIAPQALEALLATARKERAERPQHAPGPRPDRRPPPHAQRRPQRPERGERVEGARGPSSPSPKGGRPPR